MSEATDERNASPPATKDAARAPRARVSAGLALVIVLVTPALLLWTWSRPAPVPPLEMPPLLLDPSSVAAQLSRDEADAARIPSGELTLERRRLYHEANVAEHEATDSPGRADQRSAALVRALSALVREHGAEVVMALRAHDTAMLQTALEGELPAGEQIAELGGFVAMMSRYGLVVDGRQVAPRFVVRTLFKARWNALHARELVEGLSPIEQQAYWGWLALRATNAPGDRRLEAVERYAAAEGPHADEARAVLLFDEGRLEEAHDAFGAAFARSPAFRLRNHMLACDER